MIQVGDCPLDVKYQSQTYSLDLLLSKNSTIEHVDVNTSSLEMASRIQCIYITIITKYHLDFLS